MVLNVIETSQTRYILDADDLESFLKRKFGQHYPNYDFKVEHVCDRWTFDAPEVVDRAEIRDLIEEIEERNTKA